MEKGEMAKWGLFPLFHFLFSNFLLMFWPLSTHDAHA